MPEKVFMYLLVAILSLSTACSGSPKNLAEQKEATETQPVFDLEESISRGEVVYTTLCIACHMPEGQGIEGVNPPLAQSDYLMENSKRAIRELLLGIQGKMRVNGVEYDGVMAPQAVDDIQAADVLNYVMNSWGNKSSIIITPTMVAKERRSVSYTHLTLPTNREV